MQQITFAIDIYLKGQLNLVSSTSNNDLNPLKYSPQQVKVSQNCIFGRQNDGSRDLSKNVNTKLMLKIQ